MDQVPVANFDKDKNKFDLYSAEGNLTNYKGTICDSGYDADVCVELRAG